MKYQIRLNSFFAAFLCMLIFAVVCAEAVRAENEKAQMGAFSQSGLSGWETVEFEAETGYQLVKDEGVMVLKSVSDDSASGYVIKQKVDLRRFPFLNWRWRVDKALPPMNEQTKKGDDYAARLYVVVSDGWFFWDTKALNYVWSSNVHKGITWPNAYAPENAKMMALRTSEDHLKVWHLEKRNVYEDLKQWLGKEVENVEAIAIMTDSDDSGLSASAMYGDIYFSSE